MSDSSGTRVFAGGVTPPWDEPCRPKQCARRGHGHPGRRRDHGRLVSMRVTTLSPLGPLGFDGEEAITRLHWGHAGTGQPGPLADQFAAEIAAYFAGDLRDFTLPLAPQVSAFQARFLGALQAIPYGETRTYGDLAKDLGVSPQAIGQACGANPIAIVIPCHRVLAADGLGGYSGAGGIEAKVRLLRLEGAAGLLL